MDNIPDTFKEERKKQIEQLQEIVLHQKPQISSTDESLNDTVGRVTEEEEQEEFLTSPVREKDFLNHVKRTVTTYKKESHLLARNSATEVKTQFPRMKSAVLQMRDISGTRKPYSVQISYSSTVSVLNNKIQFPSFLRTVPSDDFQSRGLVKLIKHFKWNWIGILAEEGDYGEMGSQIIKEEAVKAGTCIAFHEIISATSSAMKIQHETNVIRTSSATVILVFSNSPAVLPIINKISNDNIAGKVWIASEAWSTSAVLSIKELSDILQGTIGFAVHKRHIAGFKEFLISIHPFKHTGDIFTEIFWEQIFGCKWPYGVQNETSLQSSVHKMVICSGKEDLLLASHHSFFDTDSLQDPYSIYNTVYAVAHALHNLLSCPSSGHLSSKGACTNLTNIQSSQLLHFIKNVKFTNAASEIIFFDAAGNPPPKYDILNWQRAADGSTVFQKVGLFDYLAHEDEQIVIEDGSIKWNGGKSQTPTSVCSPECITGHRKVTIRGQPVCCFDCVACSIGEIANESGSTKCLKCPDSQWPNSNQDKCLTRTVEFLAYEEPVSIALSTCTGVCCLLSLITLIIFVKYFNSPIVRANNNVLSLILLTALTLSFLCTFLFIGRPTVQLCLVRQAAFGIVFVVCVSSVLAKTITVVIAFSATKPHTAMSTWVGPKVPNILGVCSTSVQVFICISWLLTSPPFPVANTKTYPGKIILECNENNPVFFWVMLGYMGLLAVLSFVLAFVARKLPDSFNEAKFITFSMLAFVSVWLSFIPAYLSTQGKFAVVVEIFAVIFSSGSLLFCIFSPKVYIIIFKPFMNTREYLIRK
ncbi:extracellular calcium-sensing receptor-like [Protopterus annectens]|uniref:extracellular calcium-sensing receptor-like n=1 Tax=Protopterus annectens TaxID=7888 RepID=UPI001CF93719|nr:extracellular calcium-sensing receptor-like [Protopterus annectens]